MPARTEAGLTVRADAGLARVSAKGALMGADLLIERGVVRRRPGRTAGLGTLDFENEATPSVLGMQDLCRATFDRLATAVSMVLAGPATLVGQNAIDASDPVDLAPSGDGMAGDRPHGAGERRHRMVTGPQLVDRTCRSRRAASRRTSGTPFLALLAGAQIAGESRAPMKVESWAGILLLPEHRT